MEKIEHSVGLTKRLEMVDFLRGVAVLQMIIFHLLYDLSHFSFIEFSPGKNTLALIWPRLIVSHFLFSVGLSLPLLHYPNIRWRKFLRRELKLVLSALLISATTYVLFPSSWIYFGTLHAIAFLSLLALPFISRGKLAFLALIAILTAQMGGVRIPWFALAHKSMDYVPPFPWFGALLLGITLFHHGKIHLLPIKQFPLKNMLLFLGRNALIIYLLHQPILFGTIYTLFTLFRQ